ncbi:MAG: hypothetical protein RL748_2258, partial [Pseudomonadota bacterium]|jgi:hypothetical protein
MQLVDLVQQHGWRVGLVLDEADALDLALHAVRQYLAWGELASLSNTAASLVLDGKLEITLSEWGLIQPLFALYLELNNARALEASRSSGVEAYGRTVSEVQQSIDALLEALPRKAFSMPMETI